MISNRNQPGKEKTEGGRRQGRKIDQTEGTTRAEAQRQIRTRHIDELNRSFSMADTRKREWWQNARLEL